MFISVFNGANLKTEIIYRQLFNGSIIICDVEESIVANITEFHSRYRKNYGKPISG